MHKIGILWSDPALWVIGKTCHLETIVCPNCGSLETAYVLHCHLNGKPCFHRMHQCDQCGKYIGPFRWKLAAPPADVPGEAATLPGIKGEGQSGASEQNAAPVVAPPGTATTPANVAPGAGCFVCQEMRERGQWSADCQACKTGQEPAPRAAPAQGSLF